MWRIIYQREDRKNSGNDEKSLTVKAREKEKKISDRLMRQREKNEKLKSSGRKSGGLR